MKTTTISKSGIIREYEKIYNYKILGFNDDVCECDICGKSELKGTYAMENVQTGEIFRAGSTCGAKMAGWSTKELVAKYKQVEKDNYEAAKLEARNSAEYIAYDNKIKEITAINDVIDSKIFKTTDHEERNRLEESKIHFPEIMEITLPYTNAKQNKIEEIKLKYNLKNFYV